ncbi:MAG: hypothetical protein OCD76_17590 [Reichenbachiella sp.]
MALLTTFLWIFSILTPSTSQIEIAIPQGDSTLSWVAYSDTTSIPYNSALWVGLQVHGEPGQTYVLRDPSWYMQALAFYDEDGQPLGTGNSLTFEMNSTSTKFRIYYPFTNLKQTSIDFIVENELDYVLSKSRKDNFQYPFISVFLFIAFSSLVFAFWSKDKVYLHFFFYLISISYFFAYQYGILGEVFPFVNQISPSWWWISSASLSFAYSYFAQTFLNLRQNDMKAFNLFLYSRWLIGGIVIVEAISHLLGYNMQHQLFYNVIIMSFQVVIMSMIIYRIFLLRTILGNIFLFGMGILIMTTLSGQLMSTMQLVSETNYFIQSGLLIDIIIFTIGISVRIGMVYKAREQVQKELINQLQVNEQFQLVYTSQLEIQVKERTSELEKKNSENELLLNEVHHRVKNNLQMISSLINMQNRRVSDPESKELLTLTQNRVKSIGLIHEHLYHYHSFSNMHLGQYITDLVDMLVKSLHGGPSPDVQLDIVEIIADIDTAIPIGLILNELVTNAIKYAFPNNDNPKLHIQIFEEDCNLHIKIQDNGNATQEIKPGFGWTIISSTLSSINGQYELEYQNGLAVHITIQDYSIQKAKA